MEFMRLQPADRQSLICGTRLQRGFHALALWLLAGMFVANGLLAVGTCGADTWTDNTGTFKVEAEFVALQGDKVVLKKTNGTTLQVPLARLDKASQDRVRQLASLAGKGGDSAPDEYLRQLMMASEAGDYQKVWNALPPSYQKDLNDVVHSFAENMDSNLWKQGTGALKKGVRVLKEKQKFILGHPQVALAGDAVAKSLPPLADVLDAIVNSELTELEKLKTFDLVQFAAADGKRIAEKMKAASEATKELQKLAPVPGAEVGGPGGGANPFAGLTDLKASDVKITVVKRDGNSAVLRIDLKDKPGKEEEWVQENGKWLPKKIVDEWPAQMAKAKAWTSTEMKQKLDTVKLQAGLLLPAINLTFDQLLAAQSQEQFNQVIENVKQQFGGVAPGRAGPME